MLSFRVRPAIVSLLSSTFFMVAAPAVRADTPVDAPAHVAVVDGEATLERDGQVQAAAVNAPVVPGDRLQTTTGRLEVVFPDGSVLDIDRGSTVDVASPTLLRLTAGRLLLVVAGAGNPASAVRFHVDTPATSVGTDGPGEYRVDASVRGNGAVTELAVLRGSASLTTDRDTMPLVAGELSVARDNDAPSLPRLFNAARLDEFASWSADQRAARSTATSAQYLPPELQMYGGTFDRGGTWQYAAPYGYVWYPAVAPDWRPYYNGYWSAVQPYGWTWVGGDRFAWPTHHYGRWGFARGAWFWIPGRTWASAWVSWGIAPGYVSWCPLGYDSRPVFPLTVGLGDSWTGWTIVPRRAFGVHGRYVDRWAVAAHRLPHAMPFVVQTVPPIAAPRHLVSGAGGAAVSRDHVTASSISRGVPVPQGVQSPRSSTPPVARVAPTPSATSLAAPRWRAPETVAPARLNAPALPGVPVMPAPAAVPRTPAAGVRAPSAIPSSPMAVPRTAAPAPSTPHAAPPPAAAPHAPASAPGAAGSGSTPGAAGRAASPGAAGRSASPGAAHAAARSK